MRINFDGTNPDRPNEGYEFASKRHKRDMERLRDDMAAQLNEEMDNLDPPPPIPGNPVIDISTRHPSN